MNEFEFVLAHPRSIRARRSLLDAWRAHVDPRARLLELALAAHDEDFSVRDELLQIVEDNGRELAGPIASEVEDLEFGLGLLRG